MAHLVSPVAGESIYGPTFEDETFQVVYDKRGVLGMANNGLHSNSSQVGVCREGNWSGGFFIFLFFIRNSRQITTLAKGWTEERT